MIKLTDIIYETAKAWVHRDVKRNCYTVFIIGVTHSTSDSAYELTNDGLTLAIARARYLTDR